MSAKILLIEDERSQRILYKQVLEEEGYQVFDAPSGTEAMDIIAKNHPDLAILDIRLTNEDGLEIMGRLMKIDENMPIIIHTAYGAWKENFRGRLADAYVVKSSDLSELKKSVEKVLAERIA